MRFVHCTTIAGAGSERAAEGTGNRDEDAMGHDKREEGLGQLVDDGGHRIKRGKDSMSTSKCRRI